MEPSLAIQQVWISRLSTQGGCFTYYQPQKEGDTITEKTLNQEKKKKLLKIFFNCVMAKLVYFLPLLTNYASSG